MSGLILKLSPKERILINGAVIENGEKRTKLSIITQNANILRLKDAICPGTADTPVKKVCYINQLLLSGETDEDLALEQLLQGIHQLETVFKDNDSQNSLHAAKNELAGKNYYKSLKLLRGFLALENTLMSRYPSDA